MAIQYFRERKRDYLWILIGTMLMAASANLFYNPANMVPGGFTGVAIIIQHLTQPVIEGGLPLWLGNLILNVPLVIVALIVRGWRFVRRTILATGLFSVWLYIIPECALAADDLFLTAAIGGLLMGVGLGCVFFGKATTGGTDTIAAIIQRFLPHLNTAKIMPVLDAVVVLLSVWIFGIRVSLYAVITVILNGAVADGVVTGFRNASLAYIISDKHEEIAALIMKEMSRGVTRMTAKGGYTGSDKPVLFVAVSKREAPVLQDLVSSIDSRAFMIVTDAREIRGEGFLQFTKEEV